MSQNARYARVAHTKSRNGCKQCKKRRVKCDLRTPECSNCHRRREFCDYNRSKPGESSSGTALVTSSSGQSGIRAPLKPAFGEWDSLDFLTAMPAIGSSLSEQEIQLWRSQAVKHLGDQSYLQHNVLALAALQRYLTSPEDAIECYTAACTHHLEASRIFRQTTTVINNQNWLPAYVLCTSVIMFHFAVSQLGAHPYTCDPMEPHDFLEAFFVLRLTSLLSKQLLQWFPSTLKGMIKQRLDKFEVKPDLYVEKAVSAFCSALDEVEDVDGSKSTLTAAATFLREWVHGTDGIPRSWVHIIWWPAVVGQDFISLLERRSPLAVVIFIYWSTILSRAPSRWYLDGWSKRTVAVALEGLPPDVEPMLRWPREVLGLENTKRRLPLGKAPPHSPPLKVKTEFSEEVQKYYALRSASTDALDEMSKAWRSPGSFNP